MAAVLAPLPALASPDLPPWATDICSQSHAAPQAPAAPDQPACPHALCCLLGCAAHHGASAVPCAPLPPTAAATDTPRFARADPARLPGTQPALLPRPRGPPAAA